MILEDKTVSYQKIYQLSDFCYNLVNVCEKRKKSLHHIGKYQVYSPDWDGWSLYQLSLDERKKELFSTET